jgi:hypothetical protein
VLLCWVLCGSCCLCVKRRNGGRRRLTGLIEDEVVHASREEPGLFGCACVAFPWSEWFAVGEGYKGMWCVCVLKLVNNRQIQHQSIGHCKKMRRWYSRFMVCGTLHPLASVISQPVMYFSDSSPPTHVLQVTFNTAFGNSQSQTTCFWFEITGFRLQHTTLISIIDVIPIVYVVAGVSRLGSRDKHGANKHPVEDLQPAAKPAHAGVVM